MKLLIIDEPWGHTPWLVQACIDRGIDVTVAVAPSGIARCRTLGVAAEALPTDEALQPAALSALAARGGFDRLQPVSERLLQVCAATPALRALTLFPVDDARLPLLADRRPMLDCVAALGIDVPPSRALPSPADITAVAEVLGWPLVLRGGQGTGAAQVRIVRDMPQAQAAWHDLHARSGGEPYAQGFVDGRIVIVGALCRGGQVSRAVCSEPVARWPQPTSPSLVQRTFRDPALEALTRRLFAALGYDGLGCLELMQRPDGGYTFIELNPRAWGSLACTRPLGIDFAGDWAAQLAGSPCRPAADPFAVPAGRDLPVFPRYLKARLVDGGPLDPLRHPLAWWRGLRGAPWQHPRLLLALLRQLAGGLRQWRAARRPARTW